MFRINRLIIVINSEGELYGTDLEFNKNLNIIRGENTSGKSSCIDAIFYALGQEELIGRKGETCLKSALRQEFKINGENKIVEGSKVYLEISNRDKTIVIERVITDNEVNQKLIKVYEGTYSNKKNLKEYFLHDPGSATHELGFHKFLEDFFEWKLPDVPSYKGKEIKLYMQTVFAAFFIEQKKGWSDFLSTIPTIYGIKNVSNRVIEFILNLDVMENNRRKEELRERKKSIESEWNKVFEIIKWELNKINGEISNINNITLDNDEMDFNIYIRKETNYFLIDDEINNICMNINNIETKKISHIGKVSSEINKKYNKLSTKLYDLKDLHNESLKYSKSESNKIESYDSLIAEISNKLIRSKDIKKLEIYGKEMNINMHDNYCMYCNQSLSNITIGEKNEFKIMSIEDSIDYLENKKNIIQIAKHMSEEKIKKVKMDMKELESEISSVQTELRQINKDLISDDRLPSESEIINRLKLQEKLKEYQYFLKELNSWKQKIIELRAEYKRYKDQKAELPEDYFSIKDKEKIRMLSKEFKELVALFGYYIDKSDNVEISEDKYFPTINGFDMKYDSSASDSIRGIWAYTCALAEVSSSLNGNHSNVIIFDEPGQHQMNEDDLIKFLSRVKDLKNDCQTIVTTSIKKEKLEEIIKNKKVKYIDIKDKTIVKRSLF